MKRLLFILLFALSTGSTLVLTSCREDRKDAGDKIEEAAEDTGDAIEEGAEDVEDAAEDAVDDN